MDQDEPLQLAAPGRLKTSLRGTFKSLKHRNFRLYFIGQTVSNTGNWLTNIAITLLVLQRTNSGLAVGLLAACQYGPILLLSIYGGVIADRYNKRRTLLLTQTLEMIESIGLAVLAFLPHMPLYNFYLVAVAGGVLLAFDNPLRRSFVSEMVPSGSLSNAVVLYSLIVNTARVLGPALAGALVVTFGYGWAFAIDAATYLAVISSLLLMREPELHRDKPRPREKGELSAGFKYVYHAPILLINFSMLMVIGTLAYNFNTTLPLFVTKGLHAANGIYTVLYSLMGVGSVITALIVAQRNLVKLRHAIGGAAILGVTMLLLAVAPNVYVAAPIALLLGAGSIIYTTATTSLVQLAAENYIRGRVLALQTVLLVGTTPLGSPLLGWLADAFGGRTPLFIGGLVAIFAAVGGYFWAKQYHQIQQRL
jgi:MFS family permease